MTDRAERLSEVERRRDVGRREAYGKAVNEAVMALHRAEQYALMIGREDDVADIRAALLALERVHKMLKQRGSQ